MRRYLRRERRKGRTRGRKEEPGRNGRELGAESGGGVKIRDADPARGGAAHAGTGRRRAGLGELGLPARLPSAPWLGRCLNIHYTGRSLSLSNVYLIGEFRFSA